MLWFFFALPLGIEAIEFATFLGFYHSVGGLRLRELGIRIQKP